MVFGCRAQALLASTRRCTNATKPLVPLVISDVLAIAPHINVAKQLLPLEEVDSPLGGYIWIEKEKEYQACFDGYFI
jgi:hypothetical protein